METVTIFAELAPPWLAQSEKPCFGTEQSWKTCADSGCVLKMHELAPGIDLADPQFAKGRGYSSLAAYNRSKLAQVFLSTHISKHVLVVN